MDFEAHVKRKIADRIDAQIQSATKEATTGINRGGGVYSLQGDAAHDDLLSDPNQVYVRAPEVLSGHPFPVWNTRVGLVANLPVLISRIKGRWEIVGVNSAKASEQFGTSTRDVATPEKSGATPNLTRGRDFYPGRPRLWKTGTLLVNLSEPYPYIDTAGAEQVWTPSLANALDLSTHVPSGAQQRYVYVCLNPDAISPALVAVDGTAQSLALPLAADAFKSITIPDGYIRFDAVRLATGDVDETTVTEDRWKYGRVASASGGSGTALTITDGVTPVSNVSEIDVTGATVTDLGAGVAALTITGGGGSSDGWIALGQTLVYDAADSPSFTMTCVGVNLTSVLSAGMRLRIAQTTGGTKYFIITAIAFSTDTAITVYGGTDYALTNETISSPVYSTSKAPIGFPLNPSKWSAEVNDISSYGPLSPAQNVWYDLLQIDIPVGAWQVSYSAVMYIYGSTSQLVSITLSTGSSSQSDPDFTSSQYVHATELVGSHYRQKWLSLTSKTTHYLNVRTGSTGTGGISIGSDAPTIIRAVCAYL